MNNILSKLEGKRIRYTAKIEEISERNVLTLSNIRVLGRKIILGDHLTMNKSQEMSNLGLKVGDIIKYTATLKKRISGYIGTNIYFRYKSPKKEFYKFMNPTAVSKEG